MNELSSSRMFKKRRETGAKIDGNTVGNWKGLSARSDRGWLVTFSVSSHVVSIARGLSIVTIKQSSTFLNFFQICYKINWANCRILVEHYQYQNGFPNRIISSIHKFHVVPRGMCLRYFVHVLLSGPDLGRSNLIRISETQGTCSRTQGFVEKGKIALDN